MYISRRIDRSTASGRRQFENPDVQSSLSNFRSAYHIRTLVFGAGVLQCTLNQIFDPSSAHPPGSLTVQESILLAAIQKEIQRHDLSIFCGWPTVHCSGRSSRTLIQARLVSQLVTVVCSRSSRSRPARLTLACESTLRRCAKLHT